MLSESLGQALYFYLNHPVRFVRLTGVVVSCEKHENVWVMELDDGSGAVINVVYRKEQPIHAVPSRTAGHLNRAAGRNINAGNAATAPETVGTTPLEHGTRSRLHEQEAQVAIPGPQGVDMAALEVGKVVKVKGTVSVYWGNRQIDLKRMSMDTSPELKSCFSLYPPSGNSICYVARCWLHLGSNPTRQSTDKFLRM